MRKTATTPLKRFLAAMLALVMVVSLMPWTTVAYAAETDDTKGTFINPIADGTDPGDVPGDVPGDDPGDDPVVRDNVVFPADKTLYFNGQTQNVVLTVDKLVSGDKLTYTIGENTKTVDITADGSYDCAVEVSEIGTSEVSFLVETADANVTYEGSITITVMPILFPENPVLTYKTEGQNAELQVKQMAAGTVLTYEMGELKGEVPVEADGTASVSVPVTNVGNYAVKLAVFAGELELAKADVTVQVVPAPIVGTEIKYGSDSVYEPGVEHTLATVTGLQKDDAIVWVVNNVETAGVVESDENGKYYSEYKEVNAGEYDIIAKITRNDNYEGYNYENGKVTIAKKQLVLPQDVRANVSTYDGKEKNLVSVYDEIAEGGELRYYVAEGHNAAAPDEDAVMDGNCEVTAAGNYTVFYRVIPLDSKNYEASDVCMEGINATVQQGSVSLGAVTAEVVDPAGREVIDNAVELKGDTVTVKLRVEQTKDAPGEYSVGLNWSNDIVIESEALQPVNENGKIYHDFLVKINDGGSITFTPTVREKNGANNISDTYDYETYTLTLKQSGSDENPMLSFENKAVEYVINADVRKVSEQTAIKGDGYSEFAEDDFVYSISESDKKTGLHINAESGEVNVDSYLKLVNALNANAGSITVTVTAELKEAGFHGYKSDSYELTVKYADIANALDLIAFNGNAVREDWYREVVTVKAAEGYKVHKDITVEGLNFAEEITYSSELAGVRRMYLANSNGEFCPIDPTLNIDLNAPVIGKIDLNKSEWKWKQLVAFSKDSKNQFDVTVYVYDSNSGVNSLSWNVEGAGETVVPRPDTVETTVIDGVEYEIWNFSVPTYGFLSDEFAAKFIVVAHDFAGWNGADTARDFIWDMRSPELQVTHYALDEAGEITLPVHYENGVSYYKNAAQFGVMIQEGVFDSNLINIALNGAKVSGIAWTNSMAGRGTHMADVNMKNDLSNVLTVDGCDVAGNALALGASISADESFVDGVYTSGEVVVDLTAPVLSDIKYNSEAAQEGLYTQKAEVSFTITERFFDKGDVKVTYEAVDELGAKTTGKINNINWSHSGDAHVATFPIEEDGDYQIAVDFSDKVGHALVKDGAEFPVFTVDTTAPTMVVTYDNNDAENLKYYDAARTATVVIHEHNFSWDGVVFTGVDEAKITKTDDGDDHIATIVFDVEGDFEPTIDVADLAGNSYLGAEQFTDEFTLDWTIENPVIGGVANGKAYKGGVYPTITMKDINFDKDGYTLRLTRTVLGEHDVDVTAEFLGELKTNPQGAEGSFGDFAREQVNDGIYTLTATIKDLAGNESSTVVTFSVNRFGSVYKYDSYLVSLIKDGGAYVRAIEKDLIITEYNADRLLEGSLNLTITRDGRPVENVKFTATPNVNEFAPLGASGWYQYQYTISKDNFAKDGLYKISVSSEDMAGNTPVNNSGEGMEIVFRVDATPAELTSIVGLEESIVNAAELNVRYTVFDAMGIRSIKVYVDGALVGSEITEFGGDKNNYNGSFTIGESNTAQTVRIVVEDLVGNITDTDAASFTSAYTFNNAVTVSTNVFVRLYANKPLFFGTCAGTAAAVAGIALAISKRRKREEEIV